MIPADCQPQLQENYRRETWVTLLPHLLPRVELFTVANDSPLTNQREREISTARRQFGSATLADGKRIAFYEVTLMPAQWKSHASVSGWH